MASSTAGTSAERGISYAETQRRQGLEGIKSGHGITKQEAKYLEASGDIVKQDGKMFLVTKETVPVTSTTIEQKPVTSVIQASWITPKEQLLQMYGKDSVLPQQTQQRQGFVAGLKEGGKELFLGIPLLAKGLVTHPLMTIKQVGIGTASMIGALGVQQAVKNPQTGKYEWPGLQPYNVGKEIVLTAPFIALSTYSYLSSPKPIITVETINVRGTGQVDVPLSVVKGMTTISPAEGYESIGHGGIAYSRGLFGQTKTVVPFSFESQYGLIGTSDKIGIIGKGSVDTYLLGKTSTNQFITKGIASIQPTETLTYASTRSQFGEGVIGIGSTKEITASQYQYYGIAKSGKAIYPITASIKLVSGEYESMSFGGGIGTVQQIQSSAAAAGAGQSLSVAIAKASLPSTMIKPSINIVTPINLNLVKQQTIPSMEIGQISKIKIQTISATTSDTTTIQTQGFRTTTIQTPVTIQRHGQAQMPKLAQIISPITAQIAIPKTMQTTVQIQSSFPSQFWNGVLPPTAPFSFTLPQLGFGSAKKTKGFGFAQPKRYQPSLRALVFNIKAPSIPKMSFTGIGLSPIIGGRRRKRRKR